MKNMSTVAKSNTKKDAKQLRQQQKNWLDDIHTRTGDSYAQMVEACNLLAARTGQRMMSKETLRHFYNNYQDASKGPDRLLSDRVVFMLYKVYGLEPTFAPHLLYDMDKDDADISPYVKHCKQYIADVSMAKGIYRIDVARAVGIADSKTSRLFNDKLIRGVPLETLEAIREKFGVNFSPRLRAFLETEDDSERLPVVGSIELRSGEDRVWMVAESDYKHVAISLPFLNAKQIRAVEFVGPNINPFVRGGMLLVYLEGDESISKACINQTCIVQTMDGVWHLKVVRRSDKSEQYRLESVVSNSIEEHPLKCAYKIELAIMPRA